jgi:hypothetical protein
MHATVVGLKFSLVYPESRQAPADYQGTNGHLLCERLLRQHQPAQSTGPPRAAPESDASPPCRGSRFRAWPGSSH